MTGQLILCISDNFFYRCGKMAKRIAEKELTDRNWDQEDEAEEVKLHIRFLRYVVFYM